MKRVFIFGVVGFAAVAILLMGLILGVIVTPARAQVGRVLGQAIERAQSVMANAAANSTAQAQTPAAQLKDEKGILVGGVFQNSPADKAGLLRGDIILEVGGQEVNSTTDLTAVLSQHKAGDSIALLVQHGDAQKTVTVTLAEPPGSAAAPQGSDPQNQPPNRRKGRLQSGPYLGIVSIGAGQFNFKAEEATQPAGARITQVSAGSPAEQAGLKAGEVITAVDGTAVDAQNNLGALITAHKPGDSVTLTVQGTDGNNREVKVTLADHPQQAGTAYLGVSTGGFGRGHRFGFPGMPNGNGQGQQIPMPHNFPGLVNHPGALLQQVTAGSPAEKAGLKAGQVIEAVDGKKPDGAQAFADAIAAHKPGDTVTLTVYDPQADQSSEVKVTLGENPDKAGAAWLGIQFGYFNFQDMPMPQKTPGAGGTQF